MKTFRITYDNIRNNLTDCYMDIDALHEESAMQQFGRFMDKIYHCPGAIKFKKIEMKDPTAPGSFIGIKWIPENLFKKK